MARSIYVVTHPEATHHVDGVVGDGMTPTSQRGAGGTLTRSLTLLAASFLTDM